MLQHCTLGCTLIAGRVAPMLHLFVVALHKLRVLQPLYEVFGNCACSTHCISTLIGTLIGMCRYVGLCDKASKACAATWRHTTYLQHQSTALISKCLSCWACFFSNLAAKGFWGGRVLGHEVAPLLAMHTILTPACLKRHALCAQRYTSCWDDPLLRPCVCAEVCGLWRPGFVRVFGQWAFGSFVALLNRVRSRLCLEARGVMLGLGVGWLCVC
jgi:hypothetical protein